MAQAIRASTQRWY